MACRIGMTTDPDERKRYWESKIPSMFGWKIFGHYQSKTEAQNAETDLAHQYGCVAFPGGGGPEIADWVVYGFQYRVMQYEPPINQAVTVKKIPLSTKKHTAALLDEIEAAPGGILYRFVLAVLENDSKEPCFYVAAEMDSSSLKNFLSACGRNHFDAVLMTARGKINLNKIPKDIPYVLGAFPGDGHINYGSSEDWGHIEKFEREALRIAEEFLQGKNYP